MELTELWAGFAATLTFEQLPVDLIPILRGLLLDTVGVSLAASTLSPCARPVLQLGQDQSAKVDCLLLGSGDKTSCLMAGMVNGTLAHALNFDAVGRWGGHIGFATVPAPLAIGEARGGVSGKQFLAAMALGAELTTRLAASIDDIGIDVHEKFLEGQVLGVFGAAIGAGKVIGFDAARMHHLFGLALMQSGGTRQVSIEGGAGKAMAGGLANHAGLLAAMLAEQGVDARCAALEGRAGLYALFYGGRYRRSAITDHLGEHFLSAQTVFKRWPTSGMVHPFIAAALQLRKQHRLALGDIVRIHIRAGEASRGWIEPEAVRRRPANGASAANSIFFGVAKALANGDVTLGDFSDEGLVEAGALALASVATFAIETAIGRGAIVEVEVSDGTILSATADVDGSPVGFDDLAAKFRQCARYSARPIADDAVEAFIDQVWNLEKLSDIRDLLGLLHH